MPTRPSVFAQLTAILLLSLLPSTTLLAQDAAPVFHVNTRIVLLDIVVTDKKGNVYTNLTKDDFIVYEDQQPQKILTFEPPSAHALPSSPDGKAVVNSAADLSKIGNAPVTILVLDELNTAFSDMAYGRYSLQQYLLAQPKVLKQPTTLLVVDNTKFTLLHDYTQNRGDLLKALKSHKPQFPYKSQDLASGGAIVDGSFAVERITQTVTAMIQIAEATRGTPGRKNVIWVGVNAPSVCLGGCMSGATDPIVVKEMNALTKRIIQILLETRVTMYYVDPTINTSGTSNAIVAADDYYSDAFVPKDPFTEEVRFDHFAPATGGKIYYSRNDVDNEIANSIDTSTSYFSLSYSPSNRIEDSSKYRNIKVRIADHPELTAITREGYYPEPANSNNQVNNTELPAAQRAALLQLDLSQATLSGLPYNGLSVTAQQGANSNMWQVSVLSKNLAWTTLPDGKQHAEITELVAVLDEKNKLLGHVTHEMQFDRKPGQTSDTINFQVPADIPSGTAHIRFVVRDAASGRIGTADITP